MLLDDFTIQEKLSVCSNGVWYSGYSLYNLKVRILVKTIKSQGEVLEFMAHMKAWVNGQKYRVITTRFSHGVLFAVFPAVNQ